MLRASELTQKEVINVTDGKKIGMICDLEIDLVKGKINAIIIPGAGKFMGLFGKEEEFEILWSQIKKIGEDVILVEMRNGKSFMKQSSEGHMLEVKAPEFIKREWNENDGA